jgi:D-glycero-D-manno-heptose 1,7-bisphosphate phosphatase
VGSDPSLCDYIIEERNLRSALMEIKPLFEKLKGFKGEISFDGSRLNKCLFLDRDGVVIEDVEYIKDPNQVRLVPKMINVLKAAREKGYRLVIVTNQSGIGRGMYNWGVFEKVNDRMLELLAAEGVVIDRILMSAYFENSQYASGIARKSLRKPRPGMIHTVSAELRIDLAASIMVGDRARDLMAAAVAGIQKLFLMSSKDSAQELNQWQHWNLRSRFENKNTVTKSGDWNEVLNLL